MAEQYLFEEIMVVDDNRIDRFITGEMVKKHFFAARIIDFSTVMSGLEHLQQLLASGQQFPPVILLDVNMPIMDGFDFLDGYLKLPEHARNTCTVVMISATNSEDDFRRIGEYTVVKRFFNKPLTKDNIAELKKKLGGAA
jgi:CheY-like chemotaxis protein